MQAPFIRPCTPSSRHYSRQFQCRAPSRHASQNRGRRHCSPSSCTLARATALFRVGFPLPVRLYFHQNIVPKTSTMRLIQAIIIHCPHEILIPLFPCSHSSQTSKNRFGSSVITPSSSVLIAHLIMSSSLTVQTNNGLPFAFTSRMKRAPKNGSMRVFCSMLKETLGTERKLRA